MVNALAGCGKTTTGLWGLGDRVKKGVIVTPEQKAIVEEMRKYGKGTKAACAFNVSIRDELKARAPVGVEVHTSNGFGNQAWCAHLDISKCTVDQWKNGKLFRDMVGKSMVWKERARVESAVDKIVGLAKCYLFDISTEANTNWLYEDTWTNGRGAILWLCDRFDIDNDPVVLDYAVKVFLKGLTTESYIDFDDQIFMPLFYNVQTIKVFDHLLVDEVQDLNRAKQELAFRMGKQITAIGDINQAIYGFSGADSESMDNMWRRMMELDGEAKRMPLTVTRRCPKLVVKLANTIVPDLRAADDAPDGIVAKIDTKEFIPQMGNEPSMIICRVNAPLTSLAFRMISERKRCYIQGRDIGSGLKSELRTTGTNILTDALAKAYDKIDKRIREVASRDFVDEAKIEALHDKKTCIEVLSAEADTIEEFNNVVDSLFKDSGGPEDTRLSSCHKAKGLEHKNVFIYAANKLRLKMKQAFQRKQEDNLAYVAYTRSMHKLVRVYESDDSKEYDDGSVEC